MSLLLWLKYISVHQPFCAIEGTSEGNREPRNEVWPISPSERLVGFEPRNFPSDSNASTH